MDVKCFSLSLYSFKARGGRKVGIVYQTCSVGLFYLLKFKDSQSRPLPSNQPTRAAAGNTNLKQLSIYVYITAIVYVDDDIAVTCYTFLQKVFDKLS